LVVEHWERVMAAEEGEEKKGQKGGGERKVEYGEREGWGADCIVLRYNGLVVRTLKGGLAEWKRVYAEALALRYVSCLLGRFDQRVSFKSPPLLFLFFVTPDLPLERLECDSPILSYFPSLSTLEHFLVHNLIALHNPIQKRLLRLPI